LCHLWALHVVIKRQFFYIYLLFTIHCLLLVQARERASDDEVEGVQRALLLAKPCRSLSDISEASGSKQLLELNAIDNNADDDTKERQLVEHTWTPAADEITVVKD